MQDKLPDAVRTRYWTRGGLLGRHARHGLQDGGAMPSFSLQCSPELLLQSPGLATHVAPLSLRRTRSSPARGGVRGDGLVKCNSLLGSSITGGHQLAARDKLVMPTCHRTPSEAQPRAENCDEDDRCRCGKGHPAEGPVDRERDTT